MDISYFGHASFKLRGSKAAVVTDPYDRSVGFSYPRVSADIVTVSHEHFDHSAVSAVSGTSRREHPFVINSPGEYEVSGISVFGIPTYHDSSEGSERGKNTIYTIHFDDISVGHLGDLGHLLSSSQIEEIGDVDVLLVPVGGVFTIGAKEALEVVNQLQPSIIIPMHFRTDEHDPKKFGTLEPVESFLQEGGFDQAKRVDKLSLSRATLPEEMEVVVMKSSIS